MWIPDDGEIAGPLGSTKYPVTRTRTRTRTRKEEEEEEEDDYEHHHAEVISRLLLEIEGGGGGERKKFDVIVIGMQEAAFLNETKKSSRDDEEEGGGDGGGGVENNNDDGVKKRDSGDDYFDNSFLPNPFTQLDDVVLVAGDGIVKEGKSNARKMTRTANKMSLAMRSLGLTSRSRPVYKSPLLRNASNMMRKASGGSSSDAVGGTCKSYDTRKLLDLIKDRCPSYGIVTSNLRGQMRLIVLALKGLAEEISNVYVNAENTGIGNVLANKGGIIATFDVRGTRLSFMTAHLEAHEGETHYRNRNKNIAHILNGAKTDPNYSLQDATIISHHMFICGDLNYRTNFGDSSVPKSSGGGNIPNLNQLTPNLKQFTKKIMRASAMVDGPVCDVSDPPSPPNDDGVEDKPSDDPAANGSHFDRAKALVDAEDWNSLNEGDELTMALRKKECLVGFTTLPCNFPPTFKVARVEGYQYNEKRTPSYTDRILWKSSDGLARNVIPFLYEPCPDFITSDHKPIRGAYVVKTNRGPPQQANMAKTESGKSEPQLKERKMHLVVSHIKCTDLPIMDSAAMGGLSDPFVLFVSYPKFMLWKNAWPSTTVIRKNLNPVWREDIHLELEHDANVANSLAGSMLYMTVMDSDFSMGDDTIGTVALNLNDLCCNLNMTHSRKTPSRRRSISKPLTVQTTKIRKPILRNGQEFGMLECTISSAYLTAKETNLFLRGNRVHRPCRRITWRKGDQSHC
ncbi:hypothetical protein ACHAW5_005433 [Stephanodiscus triporus]|uniref:C2 domain-containing protein n=1 Tax=Stephanodiscus triporus TaxID=2934178 RepID=A0ABD3P2C7_9STRA